MSEKVNKLSTEPYKGVRDFYPEDMAVQNYIFSTWRKTVEKAGYAEYSSSILEYAELYRRKGSDEIVNDQMYLFRDKGDREVALRPEMTPSLARMVAAKRRELQREFPLRWFTIANCFRYERPQRGRRREHWQLNCDLMGIAGTEADVEIIKLAYDLMKAFGAKEQDFQIKINNRAHSEKEISGLLKDPLTLPEAMRLIDKKNKITDEEFTAEWTKFSNKEFVLSASNGPTDVLEALTSAGITNVIYEPTLVRGFDYYTGMVFEVFDTHEENRRSLFGGGRYDNLMELFDAEPVPTVGFGMGDVTLRDFLVTHALPLK